MPLNEKMVQDIVQEVVAKMQIAQAPSGMHGVFRDMNDAVAAAKKADQVIRRMSMDHREKIISCNYYHCNFCSEFSLYRWILLI